jgi:hypothetical protein
MEKLYIAPGKSTPEINFLPDENIFVIKGISSPEDVRALYYPVIAWFKRFTSAILNGHITRFSQEYPLKFTLNLTYFNSSSAKFLFDILSELKVLTSHGIPAVIDWVYEENDPDMKDAGSDLSEIVGIKFNYIIINS